MQKDNVMIANHRKKIGLAAGFALALTVFSAGATAQEFQLHSSTFSNGSTLPISTILNNPSNGVNTCSINGAAGGDQSPQLSWTGAPRGTQSFVVVLYDVTASFTHWGMYNIGGNVTQLPENAGVAGSKYGLQIENDFDLGMQYDGPCPPANVTPDTHTYVFRIYALSTTLRLPGSTNFPTNAETLYHGLILAAAENEILGTASITGFYSSTPPSN
jgi:Raf kinase inhibitor-like YbhB/YbcL family protein